MVAAADGADEVSEMARAVVLASFRAWAFLAVAAEVGFVGVAGEGHVAFRAPENVADVVVRRFAETAFVVSDPVTDFEDQHHVAAGEFHGGDERVGRGLVVIEHVMAAHGLHAGGHIDVQAPAGDIHLVDALVADIAVAVLPLPVPVVVEAVLREGFVGSRALPIIVVHAIRHGSIGGVADGVAPICNRGPLPM